MKAIRAVTLAGQAMMNGAVDNGERSHCMLDVRFVAVRFTADYKLAIKKNSPRRYGDYL